MTTPNPLLDFSGLPRFDAIKPEHVTPAIDALLGDSRAVVAQLEAAMPQVTWENFVAPLEDATELLGRAWGIVSHLNNVVDSVQRSVARATHRVADQHSADDAQQDGDAEQRAEHGRQQAAAQGQFAQTQLSRGQEDSPRRARSGSSVRPPAAWPGGG